MRYPEIRITHIPTGITVEVNSYSRAMHRNKAMALKLLRSKLWKYYSTHSASPLDVLGDITVVREYNAWTEEEWNKPEGKLESEIQKDIQRREKQGGAS